MKSFLETLNKGRQCVTYLYTCKFNKIAVPWRYPLKGMAHDARLSMYRDSK